MMRIRLLFLVLMFVFENVGAQNCNESLQYFLEQSPEEYAVEVELNITGDQNYSWKYSMSTYENVLRFNYSQNELQLIENDLSIKVYDQTKVFVLEKMGQNRTNSLSEYVSQFLKMEGDFTCSSSENEVSFVKSGQKQKAQMTYDRSTGRLKNIKYTNPQEGIRTIELRLENYTQVEVKLFMEQFISIDENKIIATPNYSDYEIINAIY